MEPLLSIGRQLPVRGSRSRQSRISVVGRGPERARRATAQAQLATLEEPAGPAARTPATPSVFARRAIIRTAFKNASPRDRVCARSPGAPVSISMGHARRPRDGPAAARRPARRSRLHLPGAPVRPHTLRSPRPATCIAVASVRDLPEKSGIYHFLINLSSGMGEWYMKVVYNSFDS